MQASQCELSSMRACASFPSASFPPCELHSMPAYASFPLRAYASFPVRAFLHMSVCELPSASVPPCECSLYTSVSLYASVPSMRAIQCKHMRAFQCELSSMRAASFPLCEHVLHLSVPPCELPSM
ncbi:hypothetical protein BGX38DRAFT_1218171 [Terfezia claveryi]|nr:hypothetical protein BGX38DRAFT_1218171 [Terfezia claveryi]